MRTEKSYDGELMKIGKSNEEIIFNWLKKNYKDIIDFRDFRLTQRVDVDCGIETIDRNILLAELKADNHISETGNLLLENNRFNHFIRTDKMFYLGWAWRSPAQKLIIRNPKTHETFVFDFNILRKKVGEYISKIGKKLKVIIVETDKQKTTLNLLIPMYYLKNIYKKIIIPDN